MDLKDLKVPTILVQQLCLKKIKIDEGTQVLPDNPKRRKKTNKLFSNLLLGVKKTKQNNLSNIHTVYAVQLNKGGFYGL